MKDIFPAHWSFVKGVSEIGLIVLQMNRKVNKTTIKTAMRRGPSFEQT